MHRHAIDEVNFVLEPDPIRLQETLDALAADGGTPGGGVSRPALCDTDKAVRDRFVSMATDLGLAIRVDDVGNIFGRRQGSMPDAEPVLLGSHLDTVVPGGRFDGILGVAVALETVALLNDANLLTTRPIDVVNWTGEEGARFPPAMIGSGVVTGAWDLAYAHSRTDANGISLGAELARIGYLGQHENRIGSFFASLEAHIEQGTQLEDARQDVGVVDLIEPVRWCTVQVTGTGGHAGGPGPEFRHEAIVAAARMIVAARDASREAADFKTTVGTMRVEPGSNNVIPHRVTFNLDIRAEDDDRLERRLSDIERSLEQIASEEGVRVAIDRYWSMSGPPFHPAIRTLLGHVADQCGVGLAPVRGHIGHDSLHLATMGPAAMVFTQTRAGLSHCEEEFAPAEAVLATAQVYANAALALANAASLDDL